VGATGGLAARANGLLGVLNTDRNALGKAEQILRIVLLLAPEQEGHEVQRRTTPEGLHRT
jgi:hypothetical protein